jgi:hypothetical protein
VSASGLYDWGKVAVLWSVALLVAAVGGLIVVDYVRDWRRWR